MDQQPSSCCNINDKKSFPWRLSSCKHFHSLYINDAGIDDRSFYATIIKVNFLICNINLATKIFYLL